VLAAEAFAKVTGRPGIATVTAGPGVTNAVTGLAVANTSGSPVMLLSGKTSTAKRHTGTFQDMDGVEVVRGVTKYADTVYLTDRDRQTVTQWTLEGQLLRTWGTPDQPGAPGEPFNEPTRAIVAPNGDLYVSDGYGQHRAHRFAPDGTLIRSWGEKGTGPGQFGWPVHSVHWHPAGKILIVDRENNRVQHFTPEGDYLMEWTDFHVPQDIYIAPEGVLYVAEGRGTFLLDGREHPLEPDTGVFVVAGETYEIDNPGPDDLLLITVVAPQLAGHAAGERRAVRYREQPELPAGKDREFRYLVDKDVGCRDVTQFVGLIPPGRSPMHSHTYDEVVYVIEGQGVLHLGGSETPIAAGSCIHLPPLEEHCLENTGSQPMRVLGVFHPSGDPASRATE